MLGLTLPSLHRGCHVQDQVLRGVHLDHFGVDQQETGLSLSLDSGPDNVVDLHAVSHTVCVRNCVSAQHQLGRLQELVGGNVARVEVKPEPVVVHESMIDFALWRRRWGEEEEEEGRRLIKMFVN